MNLLHRFSIRNKILFLAVLSCLACVVFFGVFTFPNLKKNIDDSVTNGYQLALDTVGSQLEQALQEMHLTAAKLTCDGGLVMQANQYLLCNNVVEQMSIKSELASQLVLDDYSSSVIGTIAYYLPGEPDYAFISNNTLSSFQASTDSVFYTQAPFSIFNVPHFSATTFGNNSVLSLTRYAGLVVNQEFYIYIESDPEFLDDLFSQLVNHEGELLPSCLLDSDGYIVHTSGEMPASRGKKLRLEELSSKYLPFTYESEHWSIILCIPRQEYNLLYFSSIRGYLVTLLLFLAIYSLLTFLVYRATYTPLRNFVKELSDYGLSGVYQISSSHSKEFNEYYEKIEQMKAKIRSLIEQVENENKQNAILENQLLLSRINPHFLHNTLASISEQAKSSNQDELSNTIRALNSLLYHNLGKNKITTLRDELSAVDDYVLLQQRIQNFSYQVDVHIPEDLLELQLPSFVLQPLVENCIKHNRTADLRIILRIRLQENIVFIELEDNGKGITPDQQIKLNDLFQNTSTQGMGIGLAYVNSSLKFFFAQRASLNIQNSDSHSGTQVTIQIRL